MPGAIEGGATTTSPSGLTAAQVADHVVQGKTNRVAERTSRSLWEIAKSNIMTRFNAILGAMLLIIVITGELADSLFGIVLVTNALIGIVQEWLAKRKLDALAVLHSPRAHVVRDGTITEIMIDDVVLDDLCELRAGDQICADGIVTVSDNVEVDESLLTGESDPIVKRVGDRVLSGAIVVAGSGRFQTTHVGADAYARKLAVEARRFTTARSELQDGTNKILGWVTWALLPTTGLLLWSQLRLVGPAHKLLPGVVAGVVAMVPEGLVLLTSFAFLLAARTLARRNVLVQELPAVEGLARVDVVCVDKTGTITEGSIAFHSIELCNTSELGDGESTGAESDEQRVAAALGALAADEHSNATMQALKSKFVDPGWQREQTVAFSSARKWSAAQFAGVGSWVIGAPEMVLSDVDNDDPVRRKADDLAAKGSRVLLLAFSLQNLPSDALPDELQGVALVTFEEQVRDDAAETFAYFAQQGVQLRVISGDSPVTVGAVAARAGIPNADKVFDARNLPEDGKELAALMESTTVFGRVSPHQKRAMVQALQSNGHVVAMTGDGVNDALALKDADIGIAMGSGAAATRAVAQLVLLDGQFSRMPGVVAEGRRVIANVERVSNLYITKTVYAFLIAVVVGIARWKFPFLPRHMTVVSTLTIGVPSFFLALGANTRRYVPGFVGRVARFTIPAGCIAGVATMLCYGVVRRLESVPTNEAASLAATVLMLCGLWVLLMLARPLNAQRIMLVAAMGATFVVVLVVAKARSFYALELPDRAAAWLVATACAAIAITLLELLTARRANPFDTDNELTNS